MKRLSTTALPETPLGVASASTAPASFNAGLKQQLEAFHHINCSLLKDFKDIRTVQLEAAREALQRHQECRGKLHACSTVAEALEITHKACNADLEAASRYWTDLSRICSATWAGLARNPGADWIALHAPPLPCLRPQSLVL